AFVSACALNPRRSEAEIAKDIRRLSPTATPNIRIVTIADQMLGRGGRMVAAIESIGRGVACYEGHPFRLDLGAGGRYVIPLWLPFEHDLVRKPVPTFRDHAPMTEAVRTPIEIGLT